MIKIIDKASWQIDNGVDKKNVIEHFIFIFKWLDKNDLLTSDGKEMLDIGIDSSISLNEKMVNEKALKFLEKYYDEYIKNIQYGIKEDEKLLDEYYKDFSK
ncbi:hypothetical protein [uncultured Brachyspira sp.]|uniref:hypothetical protein n=1 Tax=uncultured Brachyspira sp. TaxID=221953 RepID=UPI002609CD6C|nr:hypothetical protein [uncultured Brachyspira sp.]